MNVFSLDNKNCDLSNIYITESMTCCCNVFLKMKKFNPAGYVKVVFTKR